MITAFEFIFETPENLPPPFSHTYRLQGDLNQSFLLDYEVFYTGREQLSDEEITDEGFTINDNVGHQGEMPTIWKNDILRLLREAMPAPEMPSEEENRLYLKIIHDTGKVQEFIPKYPENWERIMQEMIQGLLEIQKIELPLVLGYKKASKNNTLKIIAEIHFAKKQGKLLIYKNKNTPISKLIHWQTAQKLMNLTFRNEFEIEDIFRNEPKNYGFFINMGDEYWLQVNKSVFNISQKNDTLKILENFVLEL